MMKPCGGLLIIILLLSGCAALQHGYDPPVVSITSFETVNSPSVIPQFKIGLHIINPNRTALELKGLAYTISLEGRNIITGVSNKLPRIDPYGEGDIRLNAGVDLFNSIRLINDLINTRKKENISYTFSAKIDAGSLHRLIRVKQKGTISLSPVPEGKEP